MVPRTIDKGKTKANTRVEELGGPALATNASNLRFSLLLDSRRNVIGDICGGEKTMEGEWRSEDELEMEGLREKIGGLEAMREEKDGSLKERVRSFFPFVGVIH